MKLTVNVMLFTEPCIVEVQSYTGEINVTAACKVRTGEEEPRSGTDGNDGYVKINGVVVLQSSLCGGSPNYRGTSLLKIDPANCSLLDDPITFDTHDVFDDVVRFYMLDEVPPEKVLVGVSFDNARPFLHEYSMNMLKEYYKVDIHQLEYDGTFAFVAQRNASTTSNPDQTRVVSIVAGDTSPTNPAHLKITVTGIMQLDIASYT